MTEASNGFFEEALAFVLKNEGGYYPGHEARDPNPTNFGVTQNTYDNYRLSVGLPKRAVRLIEMEEVRSIYRRYWIDARCGLMPRVLAITVFDHAINAGPKEAIRVLQRAIGGGLDADGIFGPKTEAALNSRLYGAGDEEGYYLASRVCFERLNHYHRLAQARRLRPNLYSWVGRVLRFRDEYL